MTHITKAGAYRQNQLRVLAVICLAVMGGLMSCGKNPVDDKPQRDTTRPTVVATVPLDHDSIVPANTVISATFSEAMDPATMTSGTLVLNPPVSGTASYAGLTLTFTPSSPLGTDTAYQATITTAAHDTAGNTIATPYVWHFTTFRDTIPPTVTSTLPLPNDSATVNTEISITFSEKMDLNTLNSGTILFSPPIAGSFNFVTDRQVVITPNQPLDTFIVYTATVTTAVTDSAGNHLASPYVWQFHTIRDMTPPVPVLVQPVDQAVCPDSLHLQAAAADNDRVSHVDFYADGLPIAGSSDSTAPYEFTWRPVGLELGSLHQIYAVAYDEAGNSASTDTVTVSYLWRLLVEDNNEAIPRNLKRIYARSTNSLLQFRVETWNGWGNYKDSATGIDVAIFLDVDQDSTTGDKTTGVGETERIGDIGADYQLIVGRDGDVVRRWNGSAWATVGNVENLVVSNNSNFFEVSVPLSSLGNPSEIDLTVANFLLSTFQWDWAPNQGHVTLVVDHSYSASPPAGSGIMQPVSTLTTAFD